MLIELDKNYPAVDDGTVYPDIRKFIVDNQFTVPVNDGMSMAELQALVPNNEFVKVADCVLNIQQHFPRNKREFLVEDPNYDGKLVDYLIVPEYREKWYMPEKEWVYTLTYDNIVKKIGMTSSGLASRFNSYNTGTKRAMIKGSCATTNFTISQCHYLAIRQGVKVEVHVHEIPSIWTVPTIYDREIPVLNKIAHKYESVLIDIYKQANGSIPFLCG